MMNNVESLFLISRAVWDCGGFFVVMYIIKNKQTWSSQTLIWTSITMAIGKASMLQSIWVSLIILVSSGCPDRISHTHPLMTKFASCTQKLAFAYLWMWKVGYNTNLRDVRLDDNTVSHISFTTSQCLLSGLYWWLDFMHSWGWSPDTLVYITSGNFL